MVLTEVRKNFKDAMIPFSNLAIDETLLLWKGRLSFKKYIKRATEHKDPLEDILGKSGVIVKDLMKPYINKGYSLFTENFYTSPQLVMYLHKRKTNTFGSVRKKSKRYANH
ncbi:hypothetical protein QTP88_019745 [Uroleucon formosanum]